MEIKEFLPLHFNPCLYCVDTLLRYECSWGAALLLQSSHSILWLCHAVCTLSDCLLFLACVILEINTPWPLSLWFMSQAFLSLGGFFFSSFSFVFCSLSVAPSLLLLHLSFISLLLSPLSSLQLFNGLLTLSWVPMTLHCVSMRVTCLVISYGSSA